MSQDFESQGIPPWSQPFQNVLEDLSKVWTPEQRIEKLSGWGDILIGFQREDQNPRNQVPGIDSPAWLLAEMRFDRNETSQEDDLIFLVMGKSPDPVLQGCLALGVVLFNGIFVEKREVDTTGALLALEERAGLPQEILENVAKIFLHCHNEEIRLAGLLEEEILKRARRLESHRLRWSAPPVGPSVNLLNQTVEWPEKWDLEQKRNWIQFQRKIHSTAWPGEEIAPGGNIAILEKSLAK